MGKSFISLKRNGINSFEEFFKCIWDFPISESSDIKIWNNPKKVKNISDIEVGTDNNNIIVRFNNNLDFLVFEVEKPELLLRVIL